MPEITRRGLLGMFAAGTAAAVLPSGIIMPVRKLLVPKPGVITGIGLLAAHEALNAGIESADYLPGVRGWRMEQKGNLRVWSGVVRFT